MDTILTSSDGSGTNENQRIKRLERVVKAYNIFKYGLNLKVLVLIDSLHDHKGLLTVTWKEKPDEEEKTLIKSLWAIEKEYEIEHVILE
ncbi:hypothetical protein MHTCC0001_32190 [Flavobacteriaceae bacterium MHTCC 0001]